jgi:guanine deaminase
MVPTLLGCGTTTAVYYSSIHERATEMLAEQCVRSGQRAFVGRVGMDHREGTPEWYRDESAGAGVDASERSIHAIRRIAGDDPLVQPILTPRFVPACTDELLSGFGTLAEASTVRVQTHCSESDWQHGESIRRYGRSDAAALDRFGLIRESGVLAHGDLLGDDDLALIAERGAGVAHCPLSNAYFANAVFPARHALGRGVKVGLGTDVAGGAHPSLLSQCAMAVTASRMLEDGVDPARATAVRGREASRLDIGAAFHLATAGGAAVLGIHVGSFSVGFHFDAMVVDTAASRIGLRRWDDVDSEQALFEKIVRLAGPTEITAVWVAGRRVVTTTG